MFFGHADDASIAADLMGHQSVHCCICSSWDITHQTLLRSALTINMQKSGRCPVIPKTVVLRYFSWPARSMKVMTFEDFSQILVQSRPPPWLSGLLTTYNSSGRGRLTEGGQGLTFLKSHLSLLIEAQDVVAHTAGPAALHFMFMSEKLLASEASSIVQLSVRQNPQQSTLPCIHIAHHSHPGDQRPNTDRELDAASSDATTVSNSMT